MLNSKAAELVNDSWEGGASLLSRAKAAAEVAERHADAVDRDARFPVEALSVIREQRLLGAFVPSTLDGEGASLGEIADICFVLGRACASTAMIFAMHQIKVACLVRHSRSNPWQVALQRRISNSQLLLASSTTEGTGGGNVRSSEAPIFFKGNRITLERNAAVISYGAEADGIVSTARRNETAPASDQVLVAFTKEDYKLERTNSWDTLGMRGTRSVGFILRAEGAQEQILLDPYEQIHRETMVPVAHILWSSVWAGVAAGAVERARGFVRKVAQSSDGQLPPAAPYLTRARASLDTLRACVQAGIGLFVQGGSDPSRIDVETRMSLLKVETSELALNTVLNALRACGLTGYRNDSSFSVGRHLRDILSAPLMINNDRILSNAAASVLLRDLPHGISD
jgi:acyl-CoA dehydrogenase